MSSATPPQRQPNPLPRTAPIRPPHPPAAQQPAAQHLMPPPTAPIAPPAAPSLHAIHPHASELLLHPFKTLYFVTFLLTDRRVSFFRKLAFLGPLALLIFAVLLPESLIAGAMGLLLPLVGLALNIPIDAGLDWILVALAAKALLRVFPAHVVYDYHAQLFHRPPRAAR